MRTRKLLRYSGVVISAFVMLFFANAAYATDLAVLHMDGANGSTVFTDAVGNLWTPTAGVQISTAQGISGGSSGYFDGNQSYISADNAGNFNFGASPFTIDFWMYSLDNGSNTFLAGRNNANGGLGYDIRLDLNEIAVVGVNGWGFNIGTYNVADANYLTANAWHNVILTSSATDVYLYVDGGLKGTSPRSNISDGGNPFRIGFTTDYFDPGLTYNGYIDEFKITDQLWTPSQVSNGVVPEPASMSLLGLGLLGLVRRYRRK